MKMSIESLNTIMVSTGIGLCIGGLVVLFVASFFMGWVLTLIGMVIALIGAVLFKPSG